MNAIGFNEVIIRDSPFFHNEMGYSGDFSNSYLEPSGACPKELDASGAYMFWRSMLFSINALGLNLKEVPMDTYTYI